MPVREVLIAGTDDGDLTKLAEYQAIGGYAGVPKALAMTSDDLIADMIAIVGSLDTVMGEVDR